MRCLCFNSMSYITSHTAPPFLFPSFPASLIHPHTPFISLPLYISQHWSFPLLCSPPNYLSLSPSATHHLHPSPSHPLTLFHILSLSRHRSSHRGPQKGERGEAVAGGYSETRPHRWFCLQLVLASAPTRHQGANSRPHSRCPGEHREHLPLPHAGE